LGGKEEEEEEEEEGTHGHGEEVSRALIGGHGLQEPHQLCCRQRVQEIPQLCWQCVCECVRASVSVFECVSE
jgi:hypothetical protein